MNNFVTIKIMRKKILIFLGVLITLTHINPASSLDANASTNSDPLNMLESVTSQVRDKLESGEREQNDVYSLINKLVLPHVDFSVMARWVAGRNAWSQADNTTRQEFIHEFKTLIVKNYAKFLMKFSGEEIEFVPMRTSAENQKYARVTSYVNKGRSSIRMDYYLVMEGTWKIYDILIEESSLLEGYKAQFADDIQQGGIEAAIEKMRDLNDQ